PRRKAWCVALLLGLAGWPVTHGGQAAIGIAPVRLTADTWHFDTAEQHGIRVDVVARGLNHPFALALLPSGDALVSERGGALRLVRDAIGNGPPREAQPAAGLPPLDPPHRHGGLHDLPLHPQFAPTRPLDFTFTTAG